MADEAPRKLKKLIPKSDKKEAIRVLYVEDAAVIRDTIVRLLELKGYTVNHAKNGKEGVELALSWHPHVILMDLRMPIMDGYKAISEIKANPQTRNLPVFVISAWSSKKERTQAKLAGADEFFVKPPDLDRLTEAIDRAAAQV
ncbi:MAG TPA: response regulator [Anaerolineae bacterium]|nr:response regulator [Anaerolineae bacterium]HMR67185.1 response regulator [Anaerolineae bacterium]